MQRTWTISLLSLALCAQHEQQQDAPAMPDADALAQMPENPQTLSQMLQWSLDHTDLDALHKKAEAIRSSSQGVVSAEGGDAVGALPQPKHKSVDQDPVMRERLRELSEATAAMMPNQVVLMREALELAANETATEEEREMGLLNLQELVSDIDNARDLKAINEFPSVMALMASEQPVLQTAAVWVLGSAAQNHREIQLHLLEIGALPSLLALVHSHASLELRAKALYAASALLRNCREAQAQFVAVDGVGALVAALSEGGAPKLVRKALVLLTDLLDEQLGDELAAEQSAADATAADAVDADGTPAAGALSADGNENEIDAGEAAGAQEVGVEVGAAGGAAVVVERVAMVRAGLLAHGLQNGTRLCGVIVQCLRMEDTDTQEKAVLALQKLLVASVLRGGGDGDGCAVEAIGAELDSLRQRCAERGADVDEEDERAGMSVEGCAAVDALSRRFQQ